MATKYFSKILRSGNYKCICTLQYGNEEIILGIAEAKKIQKLTSILTHKHD